MFQGKPLMQIHRFSLAATPIFGWCGEHRLANATGFISKVHGRPYLISNWHVFAGRHALTGQPLAEHGGCPDRLDFLCHRMITDDASMPEKHTAILVSGGSNLWLEHPVHGQAVDVAAIPIDIPQDGVTVDDVEHIPDMRIEVGQDVFILGYPIEPVRTAYVPIWKRGTIASEPTFDMDGLGKFLVDTATRSGMSGALVVARSYGGYTPEQGPSVIKGGTFYRRIGIYSGREGANDLGKVQLGIVWRPELIAEVCAGGKIGDFKLN